MDTTNWKGSCPTCQLEASNVETEKEGNPLIARCPNGHEFEWWSWEHEWDLVKEYATILSNQFSIPGEYDPEDLISEAMKEAYRFAIKARYELKWAGADLELFLKKKIKQHMITLARRSRAGVRDVGKRIQEMRPSEDEMVSVLDNFSTPPDFEGEVIVDSILSAAMQRLDNDSKALLKEMVDPSDKFFEAMLKHGRTRTGLSLNQSVLAEALGWIETPNRFSNALYKVRTTMTQLLKEINDEAPENELSALFYFFGMDPDPRLTYDMLESRLDDDGKKLLKYLCNPKTDIDSNIGDIAFKMGFSRKYLISLLEALKKAISFGDAQCQTV